MNILVAGGSGAIGLPLVRKLVADGHSVTALTRRPERQKLLERLGATAALCDVFDSQRLAEVSTEAAPEVVINQLTDLPQSLNPRKLATFYAANNRARSQGTRNLLAARAAGARRMIAQSAAFWYAPTVGDRLASEEDPMFVDCPDPIGEAVRTMVSVEQMVLGDDALEAVVLRYGVFYGPGTWYSATGDIGEQVRRGRYPMIGKGEGTTSFVYVEDAAEATAKAIDAPSGIYNVVDDEPARTKEWLPEFAQALGAKRPRRIPEWVVRPVAGKGALEWMRSSPGASNAKTKEALDWQPEFSTWRAGFRQALEPANEVAA